MIQMEMGKMIFITGFARGGTSWLRNCVGFHPEVQKIPHEMLVFRDLSTRKEIEQTVEKAISDNKLSASYFVNKAPANAPHTGKACRMFPESKFIFIIRDPRDFFISHKRGTKKWMGGKNSTVKGCMKKTRRYFEGFADGYGCENIFLVRYEDLHQDFHETIKKIYGFIGLKYDDDLIEDCFNKTNFMAVTGGHTERRSAAARKGVILDWVNFLKKKEAKWYQKSRYWSDFMKRYGYDWSPPTYANILKAMASAGVHSLNDDELLANLLSPNQVNLLLMHDIDAIDGKKSIDSILETARVENEIGYSAFYNFLPLDDRRYRAVKQAHVLETIKKIRKISGSAVISLHLNAAEKFFPKEMDDADDNHALMNDAVRYLHEQVDNYERHGIHFRIATAHGYGRKKKRPNNRDSTVFTEELKKRNIQMFDTLIRPEIDNAATATAIFNDVGGPLKIRKMLSSGPLDSVDTYRRFPAGVLIRFLTHPGNYDIRRALCLGYRKNTA